MKPDEIYFPTKSSRFKSPSVNREDLRCAARNGNGGAA